MKPRIASMTVGLAVGVTVAVVVACGAGAYLYSAHHFQTLLESARTTALAKGELVRVALEHQMMENERSLIARMIRSFAQQPRVESVMLLDRFGVKRYSAGAQPPASDLDIGSPTCQACHRYPPRERGSSRVLETRGGTVLRTVVPIRNQEKCHGCHDPAHGINGILILDYNTEEIRTAMSRDLRWMVAGSALIALLLVGAIALIVRVVVLRRLQRFETAARLIAAGDLDKRVPAEGADTLAWLAREFNVMADSVTGLVSEVRKQRERLETVINSIDDGILVLDAERRIIAANDGFLNRAGHARDDVLGRCCRDIAPVSCQACECPTLACLHSGARQVRICERRGPEGAAAWEEIHSSPIVDASGKLLQVVEVWRDISERRAAEARLAEAHRQASLGLLASGFSHELNTPLATVLMCVEGILRDGDADAARVRENAAIAREQVLRCRGITQHFLRLARGQASAGDVLELRAVVNPVKPLLDPTARAHSVTVEIAPVPARVHVRGDEADLQHALINLVLNGIEACRPGGRVIVSAEAGPPVRIRVTDDGCGIPPEHLKRIFEPFFSLRKSGTGLGLFLAQSFVRRWCGDILVDSEAGRGSTFEIVLPALAEVLAE